MATNITDLYNEVPAPAVDGLGAPGGMETETTVSTITTDPPSGYQPLTPKQRMDWNNFIRYLNRDLKIGGSPELDKRDKSIGLDRLKEFATQNEGFSITPEMVPWVQYEFQLLRDTGTLPNVPDQGYAKQFLNWQGGELQKRDISDADGWIGSLTSRQAYQEIQPIEQDPEKRYWGTDYAGATDFYSQLNARRTPGAR